MTLDAEHMISNAVHGIWAKITAAKKLCSNRQRSHLILMRKIKSTSIEGRNHPGLLCCDIELLQAQPPTFLRFRSKSAKGVGDKLMAETNTDKFSAIEGTAPNKL